MEAWSILLGLNTALRLTIPSHANLKDVTLRPDTAEFHYDGNIPAEYIIESFTVTPSERALYVLREDYIMSLSRFCELCARYYTKETGWKDGGELQSEIEDEIATYGASLLPIIPRLHYTDMDRNDVRKLLRELGNQGAYTFCDYYDIYVDDNPRKRLYQMLIEYPDDKFTQIRKSVYKLIKENFKYCLRVNTGGWTG